MLENSWSAVGNPTSVLDPSGSSFCPSGLAPVGIHHLLLSNTKRFELLCFYGNLTNNIYQSVAAKSWNKSA